LWSWSYLAARRVKLVVLAVVVSVPCAAPANEEHLESVCHTLLHRYVFDCGCTAKFLNDHLGAEQADILLKLWIYGVNGDNRSDVLDLYLQHGANKINETVMEFHRHRDQLRRYCVQGEGPTIAD
jgi:hypothetical protein